MVVVPVLMDGDGGQFETHGMTDSHRIFHEAKVENPLVGDKYNVTEVVPYQEALAVDCRKKGLRGVAAVDHIKMSWPKPPQLLQPTLISANHHARR